MNKNHLQKLAKAGITSGILMASSSIFALDLEAPDHLTSLIAHNGCGSSASANSPSKIAKSDRLITEDELLAQLNDDSKTAYHKMNYEGKILARKLASTGDFKNKNDAVLEARNRLAERDHGLHNQPN